MCFFLKPAKETFCTCRTAVSVQTAAPISKVSLEMGPVWIPATLLHVYPFLATTANNQSSNQGGLCKYGHRRRARHATSFLYAGWLRAVIFQCIDDDMPNVFDSINPKAMNN